jgi:hypothetical protein
MKYLKINLFFSSVNSNYTLNIDPSEINYNYNPLSENNLKSEEKIR